MTNNGTNDPLAARHHALTMLIALWRDQVPLDDSNDPKLSPVERAIATRLARETLRGYDSFEKFISQHATSRPKLDLRAILHLALHELWVDDSAPHGVVNSWVEIAKKRKSTAKAAGFVNSILRKADAKPEQLHNQHFGKTLAQHLRKTYGQKAVNEMNAALAQYPPTDLRIKSGFDINEYAQSLNALHFDDHRIVRVRAGEHISALAGFDQGDWWVQDLGATVAVDCFDDFDGKTLDIAAAPGGKTMQLIDRGADVTAIEINPRRAKRIHENLERTKMTARVIIGDALAFDETNFDRVLLDAPCSSTGTFRRHPDLRFVDVVKRLDSLVPLQAALLDHSFARLRRGGTLIYVTCSILPEEGEQQIERFLDRQPDAQLEPLGQQHYAFNQSAPYIRTLPSHLGQDGGVDGFFVAKITKV